MRVAHHNQAKAESPPHTGRVSNPVWQGSLWSWGPGIQSCRPGDRAARVRQACCTACRTAHVVLRHRRMAGQARTAPPTRSLRAVGRAAAES